MRTEVREAFEVYASQTGVGVDPGSWADGNARRAETDELSRHVASILERAGLDPYLAPGAKTLRVGLVTGKVEAGEGDYRNTPLIPSRMARQRQGVLKLLETFAANHAMGSFLRYRVITAGQRVPVSDLRETIRRLVMKVRRWNADLCKRYDVELLIRSIEFPFDKQSGTFHVHANIIYAPRRRLSLEEWTAFNRSSWRFFETRNQDSGRLRNLREAVKYCLKGEDVRAMLSSGSQLAVEFFRAIQGLRLVETYSLLRGWRKELEQAALKPYAFTESNGKSRLIFVKRPASERSDKEAAAASDRRNWIVNVSLPQAWACPWKEPVAVVMNPDLARLHSDSDFIALRHRALKDWRANGAPEPENAMQQAAEFNLVNMTLKRERQSGRKISPQNQRSDRHKRPPRCHFPSKANPFNAHRCRTTNYPRRENDNFERNFTNNMPDNRGLE